jgi:hypothetical protein
MPHRKTVLKPAINMLVFKITTLSLGVKLSRREADHSHLVPKSRMCGDTPPFPEYAFIAWYLVKKGEKSTGTTLSLPLSSEDGKIFSLT